MIKKFIQTGNSRFVKELRLSIKTIEVEETMDLLLHRPIGLLLSRIAIMLNMTPTHISIMSLVFGVASGFFFYWQEQPHLVLWGCVLLVISGILDTADGQVARLTKQSSRLGMVLDGAIDTFVFMAAYTGGTLWFVRDHGYMIVPIAIASGLAHSFQSMIYDFYKNEFSFLYAGQSAYRNPTSEEIKKEFKTATGLLEKILTALWINYIRQTHFLTTRKPRVRKKFEVLSKNPELTDRFKKKFKETYLPMLSWWAVFCGTNTHRTLIIIFSITGRFDYYLVVNIALSLPVIILTVINAKKDKKFLESFEKM